MKKTTAESPKQSASERINLQAKKPELIKAALEAWGTASDKVSADPLDMDGAPTWAERALQEVVKVIMPGQRFTVSGEMDMESLGELLGRQQVFGKMYGGEIPLGPEMQAEADALEKQFANRKLTPEQLSRVEMLYADFINRCDATSDSVSDLMGAAVASSHEDAVKFQKGLLRGMNVNLDDLVTGKVFQRHTKIFFVLGTAWRFFVHCRSVAEVYRLLCQAVGEKNVGDLKTFENRVARKIGMKFGPSGRPRKQK